MAKVVPETAAVRACPSLARPGVALCPQATMTRAALDGRHFCRAPGDPAISMSSAGRNTSERFEDGGTGRPAQIPVSAWLAGPLESGPRRRDRPGTANHGERHEDSRRHWRRPVHHRPRRSHRVRRSHRGPCRASPGCGVAVYACNDTNSAITVQWDQSDSRAGFVTGARWRKKPGSGSAKHQYRVHYTQGSNSRYAYYPEDTGQPSAARPSR